MRVYQFHHSPEMYLTSEKISQIAFIVHCQRNQTRIKLVCMIDLKGLTFIRNIPWQEVLDDWRERERDDWGWEEHIEARGFRSWDEFRARIYSKYFEPSEREWTLSRVDDPYSFIPKMYAGAFPGWKKYYPDGVHQIQFQDLIKNTAVAKNPKVKAIFKQFPNPTTMIGVQFRDRFVIIEGMHRACAISLLKHEGQEPEIALNINTVRLRDTEEELFDKMVTQLAVNLPDSRK